MEVSVLRDLFGQSAPYVSSTKSLAGHSLGASGAHEAVLTLLMLEQGFIAPTLNLDHVAPDCDGVAHVRSLIETPFHTALTFNTGIGGNNACLIFRKH